MSQRSRSRERRHSSRRRSRSRTRSRSRSGRRSRSHRDSRHDSRSRSPSRSRSRDYSRSGGRRHRYGREDTPSEGRSPHPQTSQSSEVTAPPRKSRFDQPAPEYLISQLTETTVLPPPPPSYQPVKRLSAETSDIIADPAGYFYKNMDINDLKSRYVLSKASTRNQIKEQTQAEIISKGKFYPDRQMATEKELPLYLHISSSYRERVQAAIDMIASIIQKEAEPKEYQPHSFRRPDQGAVEEPRFERRRFEEAKIPVSIDQVPEFQLRGKIIGPQGSFVKHIAHSSGARVQLKGRGSNFYENDTGKEADEAMYIHITAPHKDQVDRAVVLCQDLLNSIKAEAEHMRSAPPRPHHHRGGHHAPPPPVDNYMGIPPPPPPTDGYMAVPPPMDPYMTVPPPPPADPYMHAPPPPPGAHYGYSAVPPPPPGMSYSAVPPPPPGMSAYDPHAYPPPPPGY